MYQVQLREIFGHEAFKSDLQEAACRGVMEKNKDMIISLKSHGGKSLCFQLAGKLLIHVR